MIAWDALPDDSIALDKSDVEHSIAAWAELGDVEYASDRRYVDFDFYGKPFTQVAEVYAPNRSMTVDGRRVVIVASEGGHDNGREFAVDDCGQPGIAPWLARRGVTFISLPRLGRWNFLSVDGTGSWLDVPLDQRMPMFHGGQERHWPESEFEIRDAKDVSSPTGSEYCRYPKAGSELEAHMMALTPVTVVEGFKRALASLQNTASRQEIVLLYWGFSTGGSFLWPLAKAIPPDGVLGFGMANFPIAEFAGQARRQRYDWLYHRSALRVRERGLRDYEFFTMHLSERERAKRYAEALNSPRFKSVEDTFMCFNIATIVESIARLWNANFLPSDVRQAGFSALLKETLDLAFPDSSLRDVAALDLVGTEDEIQPANDLAAFADVVRPYCQRYKVVAIDGLRHSIEAAAVPVFGSLWMDALCSGYFHRNDSSKGEPG